MMFNLTNDELNAYIRDDLPYFDLTTHLQNSTNTKANLKIFTREDIILSCTEEAKKIAELLECKVEKCKSSGEKAKQNEVFFSATGSYENIHKAWRLCQVMLEYSCKISTYTNQMVKSVKNKNQNCEILGTRKTFPFAKRFCIKSLLIGGGYPHRLGLSESVLFFPQHRAFYKNDEDFYKNIKKIKSKLKEKKLVIESCSFDDSKKALNAGAEVIQLDKVDLKTSEKIIDYKNKNFPHVKTLSAGRINLTNCSKYASIGTDGIVTSSMYLCGLADISSKIEIVK